MMSTIRAVKSSRTADARMKASIIAWVYGFLAVTGLYILGPVLYFNRAEPTILGMPPLYFWFVLIPLVSPGILGAVYHLDRRFGGIGTDVIEEH